MLKERERVPEASSGNFTISGEKVSLLLKLCCGKAHMAVAGSNY